MAWNPELISDLLLECGDLALDLQRSARRSIKSDNTLVTEADTAIEDLVVNTLRKDAPDAFFIGEETSKRQADSYHRQAMAGECYITDPIDGTVIYSNHISGWGISLGFMEKGRLTQGAMLFPDTGELLITSGDQVLYGAAPGKTGPVLDECVPLSPPQPGTESPVISISQTILKWGSFRGADTVLTSGSCVSAMYSLITGGTRAYLTQTRLWDMAGAFPMLDKLGVQAFNADGTRFTAEVRDESWYIPPVEPRNYWRMKQHVMFCADDRVFNEIMKNTQLP